MRFLCDICPNTASNSEAVIIGQYEQWVRHLLSPKHQAEQALMMTRTTYWPAADWVAFVSNMPTYDGDTVELYVDFMMNLSQYGFIEALYYGSRTKPVLVALQLYGVQLPPPSLQARDGQTFEIKIIPKYSDNARNGQIGAVGDINNNRFFRTSSLSSEAASSKSASTVDVGTCTSPVPTESGDFLDTINAVTKCTEKLTCNDKKNRIKYDRDFLLKLSNVKFMPARFIESSSFPLKHLIQVEGKNVDPLQLEMNQRLQWQSNPNPGVENSNASYRTNGHKGYNGNGFRNNGYGCNATQGNWRQNVLTNTNSRWNIGEDAEEINKTENIRWFGGPTTYYHS